ncbi:MAG: hypothetical protein V8R41_03095 [Dorea formicigenerans]
MSLKSTDKTAADLIKDINAGTKTLEDIAKAESSIASELEGKSLVTAFMDLTPTRCKQNCRWKISGNIICTCTYKRNDRRKSTSLQYCT